MDPVALVAKIIQKSLPKHPVFARKVLALAYKTVAWKGKLSNPKTYKGAVDKFNGQIAQDIIASLLHPQNAVMVNIYFPCEALFALGATPMFPEGISVYVACTQSSLPFVQASEAAGIPESFCSYHKLMLGMDLLQVLPKPAFIANTTLACDANQLSFRLIAEKPDGSSVMRSVIEVPYVTEEIAYGDEGARKSKSLRGSGEGKEVFLNNPEEGKALNVNYCNNFYAEETELAIEGVAKQLQQATKTMEGALDKENSEDALLKTCQKSYQTLSNIKEYLELRKNINLPTTLTGELCFLIASHILAGSQSALDFSENMLAIAKKEAAEQTNLSQGKPGNSDSQNADDEVKQKPAKSVTVREQASQSKKPRIFWLHTLPNWQQSVMDLFETTKDLEAKAEIVGNDMSYDFLSFFDELDPMNPYDFMARRLVLGSSNGPAERRIKAALYAAEKAKADGAVLFAHWGCRQTGAMAQLAKDAFEKEGIPLLVLDGDGCDFRNASDGQMVTRLEAFIEQLSQ